MTELTTTSQPTKRPVPTIAVRGLLHSHRGPEHRHYPQRFTYLDNALLSRELDRL
ncbi:hypothetical protein [Mycobacterium sp. 1164985.4]|uniref:hypothetical protein n=1 Tax=Mycobacterium sp. 1164985.4 TaxID=1834069 RepID=UPI000AC28145|nr:hypothetical protein [Mycobacterium sp. 1164985.4]